MPDLSFLKNLNLNSNTILCGIIVIFGIIVFFSLSTVKRQFDRLYNEFDLSVINRTGKSQDMVAANGDIVMNKSMTETYNRSMLETKRDEYNKLYADYVVMSQLIALFPLLGIFGTVWGLVFSGSFADVSQTVAGLSTALWTTFYGLVCSIILKFYDAVACGKLVNLIDAKFERADSVVLSQSIRAEVAQAAAGTRTVVRTTTTTRPAAAAQTKAVPKASSADGTSEV